jgi:hypothetical protein
VTTLKEIKEMLEDDEELRLGVYFNHCSTTRKKAPKVATRGKGKKKSSRR